MRKILASILFAAAVHLAGATDVFYYAPSHGHGGLRFARVADADSLAAIADGFDFVKSDFGPWGSHKKMWNPEIALTGDGYALLFSTGADADVIGIAETKDFVHWKPQRYITASDIKAQNYKFFDVVPEEVIINGHEERGAFINLPSDLVASMTAYANRHRALDTLYNERCADDSLRFAALKPLKATLTATGTSKNISDMLMGIFFEDINYAADGGLYAELIQNRDFEYRKDEGHDRGWGPTYPWHIHGRGATMKIDSIRPLHPNNPHYLTFITDGKGASLVNDGYDGIAVKKGDYYNFSIRARADKPVNLQVSLVQDGATVATGRIRVAASKDFMPYELKLKAKSTVDEAKLFLTPTAGTIQVDMVSLFPEDTYKGRRNGMRRDLAEALEALHPQFVRFPGGCVAHGNGIDNIYDWKGSIGALEERKPLYNIWHYHQSRGLGYYEYFQFCEDLGAEPLPIIAAGVPCQNSAHPWHKSHDALTTYGQQGGIPLDSLDAYIADILDLIEYANGPADSTWGSRRAAAGHPEPFNLKYIGIGNEDMITDVFVERFTRINDAIRAAHPEITVVGTVGPFYEGSDYDAGWELARKEKLDVVDEHYYVSPAWLIYNQNYYDNYDREGTKVYLGEWAAHLPGRPSNIETALAEAIYLTSLERNADVVTMSSYAPLLAKENHTQWRPDLIYFNNTEVKPTTDYHVMRLFGENAGDKYFNANIAVDTEDEKARVRLGASVVSDDKTGDVIVKIVNILPQPATVDVDLSTIVAAEALAEETLFCGHPADEEARITVTSNTLPAIFTTELPPYAMKIIRFAAPKRTVRYDGPTVVSPRTRWKR